MPRARSFHVLVVAAVASARVFVAEAASASNPEDAALAEELFRQAKAAMEAEQWEEACPKLGESFRLDPAGGTMLTLALCHESQGRTAAAWAEFGEALSFAKRDGRANRESIARERMDALRPQLVRLRVVVASATAGIAGLVLKRDGIEIKRPAWDVAAPVDPGEHEIEATAPGYEPFRTKVRATTEGATVAVAVPALSPDASLVVAPVLPVRIVPPPPVAERPSSDRTKDTLRLGSYGAGALAVIGLGLGGYFALDARSERDHADGACPHVACSDLAAVEASRSAGHSADVATVSFIAGAVLAGAAVTLFVLSIDDERERRPRTARVPVTSMR
jgi:hypothetical protein